MRRVISGKIQCLFGVIALALGSAFASAPPSSPSDPQIQYLLKHFTPDGSMVLSYSDRNRAFLYDQALAVIAFSHAGEKSAAERVLRTLTKLQASDGSWTFQYLSHANSVEPAEEKTSPAGAIAWVAIATETYEKQFSSKSFHPMLAKCLHYLDSQRVQVDWNGKTSHPVRFSPSRGSIIAFEHNLDTYSAFLHSNDPYYLHAASDIRVFLESMWDKKRFHPGFNLEDGKPNYDENYLDTQSWGVLALGVSGSDDQNFKRGLKTNCEEFLSSGRLNSDSSPITGFVAYHPRGRAPSSLAPVWSEGSYGMLMALRVSGVESCGSLSETDITRNLNRMTTSSGGVAYATTSNDPDFASTASVAGTAWQYFYRVGYNPFLAE